MKPLNDHIILFSGKFILIFLFEIYSLSTFSQPSIDSLDTRLLGNYYYYKNDFTKALEFYAKSKSDNAFDYSLEIELIIRLKTSDEASENLLKFAKMGLDTTALYSNIIINDFILSQDLKETINNLYSENISDYITLEIYHLLMTDQMVRTGYIGDNAWAALDTTYILPRLLFLLSGLDNGKLTQKNQINGLDIILLHQVRYKNGYEKLKPYIDELFSLKLISSYQYARIIDEYLIAFNNGVQKYGTYFLPMGNTVFMKVIDEKNIDQIRAKMGIPPLSMDYNLLRMQLNPPEWYAE